ncbi:MAG: glycosyltransferase [Chloroflexi bacterium]|nr:glycosyltransferase [Chloroflexota bacterium]
MTTYPDFVIFMTLPWQGEGYEHTQRFVVSELARQLQGRSRLICLEQPISLISTTKHGARIKRVLGQVFKNNSLKVGSQNPLIFPPFFVFHPHLTERLRFPVQLNQWLLSLQLRATFKKLQVEAPVLWLFYPWQVDYAQVIPRQLLIYHCCDDYLTPFSLDSRLGLRRRQEQEQRLLQQADLVFVASPGVKTLKEAFSSKIHLLPNGVDHSLFSLARHPQTPVPKDLEAIKGPRIGYLGTLSERVDYHLLHHIACAKPEWSLVLVGPFYAPARGRNFLSSPVVQGLKERDNVHFIGARPYQTLPQYLKSFDVAIVPYQLNDFNMSSCPLKLFEYMASGKPVVTTDLPVAHQFAHVVAIAKNYDHFVELIGDSLSGHPPASGEELATVSRNHTWEKRIEDALAFITAALSERRGDGHGTWRNLDGNQGQKRPLSSFARGKVV